MKLKYGIVENILDREELAIALSKLSGGTVWVYNGGSFMSQDLKSKEDAAAPMIFLNKLGIESHLRTRGTTLRIQVFTRHFIEYVLKLNADKQAAMDAEIGYTRTPSCSSCAEFDANFENSERFYGELCKMKEASNFPDPRVDTYCTCNLHKRR